jgi:hypothetical protein
MIRIFFDVEVVDVRGIDLERAFLDDMGHRCSSACA